jgi:hypothetical protein
MRTISILSLALMTVLPWTLEAQTGFATLPAREKTRLAQQEELASESDMEFQKIMSNGMNHFEANRFKEAIEAFSEAEKKRPLNVYPPVMIEDVKLAMDLYVEPEPEMKAEEKPEPEPETPQMTADERVAIMYEKEMAKVRQGTPPPPKEKDPDKEPLKNEVKRDAEGLVIFEGEGGEVKAEAVAEPSKVEKTKEEVTKESKPIVSPEVEVETKKEIPVKETVKPELEPVKVDKKLQERLASEYKDGITETTFKEGNKDIVQRIVVKDGLGNEYRMVKHPWGGVFYFKNGTSITERVWEEETKKGQ